MLDLTNPIYTDLESAREHLERTQWPDGPICPACGVINCATKLRGQTTRPGLYKCRACEGHFTVTVGTVLERSRIPLTKWILAAHLLASSKKGFSAHQLHRTLGVTYKTAWFMAHRLREAMSTLGAGPMLGGEGKIVEADETYHGKVANPATATTSGRKFTKGGSGAVNKRAIVSLVERGGSVRSFHVENANKASVAAIVNANINFESKLFTDESRLYAQTGQRFAEHATVKHAAKEYVRGEVHTNTIEGYFSIFKRGMTGVYQHCAEKHLHRYLAEFDFRYNNREALGIGDVQRALRLLGGAKGKRLVYRGITGVSELRLSDV